MAEEGNEKPFVVEDFIRQQEEIIASFRYEDYPDMDAAEDVLADTLNAETNKLADEQLLEFVSATNDTGLRDEDVVKILRSVNGPWSAPMISEEFSEHLREIAEKYGNTE